MKLLKTINAIGWKIANIGITIYQHTLSPDKGIFSYFLKGRVCAHEPHCSAYGKECLNRYGLFPGIAYTTERVLSCKPATQKTYDPTHYRVVFFSGSPIGIPFLEQVSKDPRYETVWVVTMPDKPIGRGQQLQENSIKKTAAKLGIQNIYTPNTLKKTDKTIAEGDIAAQLQALQADWFFVIAYGKTIPQHILDIPIFWSVNVHGSLLPALRGASPLQSVFLTTKIPSAQWAHEKNEKAKKDEPKGQLSFQTGFTVMHINDKMDEWDIISTYSFNVPFSWTAEDVFTKVEKTWPKVLADTIREYSKWHLSAKEQDHTKATYCTKITKEEAQVDLLTTPLSDIYAKYRAYKIRPKIWTTRHEKVLIIEELVCDEESFLQHAHNPVIIWWNSDGTIDKKNITLNPAIQTLLLKPEGKKAMSWKDFVNGYVK